MPRWWAPSSTGCSQSSSKRPSSGSHVDHTDSPDADDGEVGLRHQVEIALQPVVRLVLRVVGDSVQNLGREA